MPIPSREQCRRWRASGQSLVEFALIVPVMLILLLTALDLGRLMYSQITVTNAAKEGALVASQGGTFQANQNCSDTNTIMCGVLTEAKGGFVEVDKTKVAVAPALCDKNAMYPPGGPPPNVSVTVTTPFKVITPIIGDFLGSSVILTGVAQAQCLVVPQVTFPSLPAPIAAFSPSTTSGDAPLTVSFDATASSSPGATIASYSWSFGASGVNVTHVFNSPGTYVVTLTVTDSRGQTDTDQATITVNSPSCPTVTADFTATDNPTKKKPHQVTLTGTVTPPAGTWSWTWTIGLDTQSGKSIDYDFGSTGTFSVTLSAKNGPCSYAVTKPVNAP
jgi:PKD repeat protein